MEKKMCQKNKKTVRQYLRLVRRTLSGSLGVKAMVMQDLRGQVFDYLDGFEGGLTVEQLIEDLGPPKEVGESYLAKRDLDDIKKRAKRYVVWRIVAIVAIFGFVLSFAMAWYYYDSMCTIVYGDAYVPI